MYLRLLNNEKAMYNFFALNLIHHIHTTTKFLPVHKISMEEKSLALNFCLHRSFNATQENILKKVFFLYFFFSSMLLISSSYVSTRRWEDQSWWSLQQGRGFPQLFISCFITAAFPDELLSLIHYIKILHQSASFRRYKLTLLDVCIWRAIDKKCQFLSYILFACTQFYRVGK